MDINQIAIICHETNRAYCETIGDSSQKPWYDAEQWQRDSAKRGVQYAIENLDAPASAQHEAWLADKVRDGWNLFKAIVKAFVDVDVPQAVANG